MARGVLSLALWALIGLHVVCVGAVKDQPKLIVSSVSVQGLVFCDECLQDKVTKSSNLLEGAKVSVVCEAKSLEAPAIPVEVMAITDVKGEFKAELPKNAFDRDGEISCAAELRESPRRSCQLLGTSRRASVAWVRQKAGAAAVIYGAGALSFRPKDANSFCQANYYMDPFKKPPFKMPPMMKPPMMKPPRPMPMPMPMMKPPMMKRKFPWLGPMMKPPMMKPPRPMPMPMPMPMMKPPMMKPKFPWPRFELPPKP